MTERLITGNPGTLSVFLDILAEKWGPQVTGRPTGGQVLFDVCFGLAAPLLCLVYDPIVFRGPFDLTDPPMAPYRMEFGCFVAAETFFLALWLLAGPRFKGLASLISGILLGGFVGAGMIGFLLFAKSLLLLLLFVGVFGFIPFVTAFVYLRNGVRAGAVAWESIPRRQATLAAVLGFVVVVAIAVNASRAVNRSIQPDPVEVPFVD